MSLAGLSLRDLEYAVAVAELRHFGRAAERCGVSQAGLSEQVRKLEAQLGLPLFERTTRRIVITPAGEALLAQARIILAEARRLLELGRSRADPLEGLLRLGVIATLGPYYVPSLLRLVRGRFPALELRLQEGRTAELAQAVRDGALDALLLAVPAETEGLSLAPLFFEPFVAAVPAGHPLAQAPQVTLAALADDGLLLLEEGHCLRDQALSVCHLPPRGRGDRFASSLEMLRHMIAAGEGHSLLPALAARNRPDLDGLVAVRELAGPPVGRSIALGWRSSDPRGEAFARLGAFLAASPP